MILQMKNAKIPILQAQLQRSSKWLSIQKPLGPGRSKASWLKQASIAPGWCLMLSGRGPYILLQKKMSDLFYENYRCGSLQTQELWVQKMFENNLTESRWTTHSFTCPAVISMPINECTALYFMFILLCPYTCSIAYCKFQQKKMKTFPEGKNSPLTVIISQRNSPDTQQHPYTWNLMTFPT